MPKSDVNNYNIALKCLKFEHEYSDFWRSARVIVSFTMTHFTMYTECDYSDLEGLIWDAKH